MKKLLSILLLIMPIILIGQNSFQLGSKVKVEKNNIDFTFNKPIYPFEKSQESYSSDNNNLVVSYVYNTTSNPLIIQIYSTPVPEKYFPAMNEVFKSDESVKSFMNQSYPYPINELLNYKVITSKNKKFIEVQLISHDIQKQIAWWTFHKGNMINISCTSKIEKYNSVSHFFRKFKDSLSIN